MTQLLEGRRKIVFHFHNREKLKLKKRMRSLKNTITLLYSFHICLCAYCLELPEHIPVCRERNSESFPV